MDLKSNFTINDKHNQQKVDEKIQENKKITLDEAIHLAGHGRYNKMIVILSGFVIMGATVENFSLAMVLPYVNCDLSMTTAELGLVSSIPFLGIVISSHFWGFMADTWGRQKVIRLSATCSLISAIVSAFASNASILILLRFIVGIFISGLAATSYTYISEFHTKETALKAAAFVSMFIPIVFTYSSIWAMFLIPMNWSFDFGFIKFVPWRLFIVAASIIHAINAIAFSFLPESPKFLLSINKSDEALKVLKSMYKINTRKSPESYPVHHLINETTGNKLMATKGFLNFSKLVWNQTKPIFVPPHLDSTVKLCFLIFTLFAIGQGVGLWFPNFLTQLQNNTDQDKTLCDVIGHEREIISSDHKCNLDTSKTLSFHIMFFSGVFCTILSGLLSFYLDKVRPRILIPTWLLLSAACSLAINVLTNFYSIVGSLIIFQSCSLCGSIVSAISVSLFPTNIRAMATYFIFMFGRIGGLVGANLVGILTENNCNNIFNVFGIIAIVCIVFFLLIKTEPPAPIKNEQTNGSVA